MDDMTASPLSEKLCLNSFVQWEDESCSFIFIYSLGFKQGEDTDIVLMVNRSAHSLDTDGRTFVFSYCLTSSETPSLIKQEQHLGQCKVIRSTAADSWSKCLHTHRHTHTHVHHTHSDQLLGDGPKEPWSPSSCSHVSPFTAAAEAPVTSCRYNQRGNVTLHVNWAQRNKYRQSQNNTQESFNDTAQRRLHPRLAGRKQTHKNDIACSR